MSNDIKRQIEECASFWASISAAHVADLNVTQVQANTRSAAVEAAKSALMWAADQCDGRAAAVDARVKILKAAASL